MKREVEANALIAAWDSEYKVVRPKGVMIACTELLYVANSMGNCFFIAAKKASVIRKVIIFLCLNEL